MKAATFEDRIRLFQEILSRENIDVGVVSCLSNTDPNLQYYIGRNIDAGFLIIPKKGNSILLASKMEYSRAVKALKGIRCIRAARFEKPVSEQAGRLITRLCKKGRFLNLGFNKSVISVNEFSALKNGISKHAKIKDYRDISGMLVEKRSIKDKEEIVLIREACRISDEIFSKTFRNLRKFRTEEDVRQFMIKETQKRGLKTSFETLVASGKNSGLAHYLGEDVPIGKGLGFIDFGVEYKGYKSDTTRAFFRGKPKKEELEKYSILQSVQEKLVTMVKPGARCSELHDAANRLLGKYSKNFTHNLGHGVGIEIHESPNLHHESKDILKPGMILTIEPGIYFPGKLGVRIEDTILVTEKGHEVLTKAGKNLFLAG